MVGQWGVTSNVIGGERRYAVYRLRDTAEVQHSGNMEYATGWLPTLDEATKIADAMNADARDQ